MFTFMFVLPPFGSGACGLGPVNVLDPESSDVGLVAHWSFDEAVGTTIQDRSGSGLHGVLTRGTWIADGRFAGALYLSRGDYVSVPDFPHATSDWTVSAWVRYAAGDVGPDLATIITTEIPSTGGWELQGPVNATTSEIQFSYNRGGPYNTILCCEILPNQWMHVTAVVDGQALTMTLYQGASEQAQKKVSASILPGNRTLLMGIEQTSTGLVWPFQGAIDEIRIYSRALKAAEILRLDAGP